MKNRKQSKILHSLLRAAVELEQRPRHALRSRPQLTTAAAVCTHNPAPSGMSYGLCKQRSGLKLPNTVIIQRRERALLVGSSRLSVQIKSLLKRQDLR